jgi:2-succinyl-6-hydroxy-2,4-cyclohexadiene-1-carboxylate synthase
MRLVLLHGFTGSARSFAHLAVDATTPDLPGHGLAPDANSWDAAVRSLAPLLEPGPVTLAGYSMGGRLALALALLQPHKVARLVLASATAGIAEEEARARRHDVDCTLADFIERRGVAAFVQRWEEHPTLASLKPFAEALRPERLSHRAAGLASALRWLGTGAQPSYWAGLDQLPMPVRIVAGARDAKFAGLALLLRERIPRAELRLLDCGHAPHLERPEAFAEALR